MKVLAVLAVVFGLPVVPLAALAGMGLLVFAVAVVPLAAAGAMLGGAVYELGRGMLEAIGGGQGGPRR